MAGLALRIRFGFLRSLARRQYAALAWAQTRIFVNSLRTRRGKSELGARIFSSLVFALIAFLPAAGMGFGAWAMALQGHYRAIGGLLWVLCLVWQFFSALAPAMAGKNPELTHLLRFPVSFGSWIFLYLVYGLTAPSTIIGTLWAAAIAIGIGVARPGAAAWIALALGLFALFNFLCSRMILAWIERFMAQRRTREMLTALFLFLALGAQVLNPALHSHRRGADYGIREKTVTRVFQHAWDMQTLSPPGLALDAVDKGIQSDNTAAVRSLAGLGLYAFAAAALLAVRLRAESRGENLSEAPHRTAPVRSRQQVQPNRFLDFSGPIAAVFEKDLHYLLRSGPMLYNLAAPLVMVLVFGGAMRGGGIAHGIRFDYALPMAMVWAFLGITRLVSNNLGGEGEGIQFYFLSPTPLRTIVLGKNVLHLVLFFLEALVITAIVIFRFGLPAASVITATLAWIVFAVPANFAAGNLLSILMPYRMNIVRLRRERGALGNGLLSMITQFLILTIGGVVILPCAILGHRWLATPILLALALFSAGFYLRVLGNVDGMTESRRESLVQGVVKAG